MIKRLLSFVVVLIAFIPIPVPAQNREYQYVHQGNKSFALKNYPEAEQFYRRALTLNPNNSRAYYNLGNAHLAQKRPQDAMKCYEKGVEMEKNGLIKSRFYHNMGVVLQSRKQFAPAIECYKNALRNNPNDEESRYNLALCQHQLKGNKNDQNGSGSSSKNKQNGKDEQRKDENQQRQNQNQQNQQNQKQQSQQDQDQMSKDNAEQLLNLSKQEEQRTREKVRNVQPQKKRLEKNW